MFFIHFFAKGNNLHDFLFASMNNKALTTWGLLLKERICSYRSKFFPLRVDPPIEGGKIEKGRVAFPEKVANHIKGVHLMRTTSLLMRYHFTQVV